MQSGAALALFPQSKPEMSQHIDTAPSKRSFFHVGVLIVWARTFSPSWVTSFHQSPSWLRRQPHSDLLIACTPRGAPTAPCTAAVCVQLGCVSLSMSVCVCCPEIDAWEPISPPWSPAQFSLNYHIFPQRHLYALCLCTQTGLDMSCHACNTHTHTRLSKTCHWGCRYSFYGVSSPLKAFSFSNILFVSCHYLPSSLYCDYASTTIRCADAAPSVHSVQASPSPPECVWVWRLGHFSPSETKSFLCVVCVCVSAQPLT